jgi:hypothetical protein
MWKGDGGRGEGSAIDAVMRLAGCSGTHLGEGGDCRRREDYGWRNGGGRLGGRGRTAVRSQWRCGRRRDGGEPRERAKRKVKGGVSGHRIAIGRCRSTYANERSRSMEGRTQGRQATLAALISSIDIDSAQYLTLFDEKR